MSEQNQNFGTLGLKLLDGGFEPIPVAGKAPNCGKGWEAFDLTVARVEAWARNGKAGHNVGLRTGKITGIDIDIQDADLADWVEAAARERFPGQIPKRVGRAPKRLLLYLAERPFQKITLTHQAEEGAERIRLVEVLGQGQQFVAYGTHPDTGKPYTWEGGEPAKLEHWELETVSGEEVFLWLKNLVAPHIQEQLGGECRVTSGGMGLAATVGDNATFEADDWIIQQPHDDFSIEDAQWAMEQLGEEFYDDRDHWRNTGMALHHQFSQTEHNACAFELWDDWSSQSAKYDGQVKGECRKLWAAGFKDERGGSTVITIGTVKHMLSDAWTQRKSVVRQATVETFSDEIKAASNDDEIFNLIAPQIREADLQQHHRDRLAKVAQARIKEITGVTTTISIIRKAFAAKTQEFAVENATDTFAAPDWARNWVWVVGEDKYVHRVTLERATITSFNTANARHGQDLRVGDDVYDPHTMMARVWHMPVVSRVTYLPMADQIFRTEGVLHLNSFRADQVVKPAAEYSPAGYRCIQAFERHMELLVPDQRERELLVSWLAYCYLEPGRKIRWSPVIKGCEGDGKSALLTIIGTVLGSANTKIVNGSTLQSSPFTGWAQGACVALIEEVRFHGHSKYEVANKLKPYIANNEVEIHAKGKDPYVVPNTVNYLLVTNHEDMMVVLKDDRRYLIIHTPYATYQDQEKALEGAWFMDRDQHYRELLDELPLHAADLALYFSQYATHPEFRPNGEAPMTAARQKTIEEGRSDEEQAVRDILDRVQPSDDGEPPSRVAGVTANAAFFTSLRTLANDEYGRWIGPKVVERALKGAGYEPYPDKGSRAKQIRWKGAGRQDGLWRHTTARGALWQDLRDELNGTVPPGVFD